MSFSSTRASGILVRVGAVVAVALLIATLVTSAASAKGRFSDVPSKSQFANEISWLANSGITTGYSDGTFRPKDAISREALAAFLYRLADSPRVSLPSKSPFKDVPRNSQFYKEIVWLSKSGITTGYSDGTFRPKANITREAMAAFLYRFSGDRAWYGDSTLFTDVSWSAKFFDEIDWLAKEGVTTGYDTGYGCREYRPKDAITREAMAAFLYRFETGRGTALTSTWCNPPKPSQPTRPADKDCADFASHWEAQRWFEKYYPIYGDFARLDGDGDGKVCEWN